MWKQNVVYAYNGTVFSLKKEGRLGETEQDPVVLAPQCPLLAFCCWKLSRVSLVREMRSAATKENSQRRPYNNTVIEHSQGPSVPPPGLQIIFWAIAWELSCRYYTRWKKGTTWWPDRAQDVSCPIPENRPQWKGTNGPWNWRLTVPKARWCWSDHWWSVWRWLSELTVLWALARWLPVERVGLWTDVHPPVAQIWNKVNFPFHQTGLFIGCWAASSQYPHLSVTWARARAQMNFEDIKLSAVSHRTRNIWFH